MKGFLSARAGQVLIGVILILLVMSILVPVMVLYTMRESRWSVKQDQTTKAFHLAEAGIEKGYRAISLSTQTWFDLVENGTPVPNFAFDFEFDDLDGGTYTVAIASGPGTNQATIISVGKDAKDKEVRTVRAVFGQNIMGDIAIHALDGVNVTGSNVEVEWGAVVSPEPLAPGGRTHPQYYSASQITGFDEDPAPPNCDQPNCWQWFAFNEDVPPDPGIRLNFYRSSAQATTEACPPGGVDYGAGPSCYFNGDTEFAAPVNYSSGSTIFIEGDLTVNSAGKIFVAGSLIVTENMNLPSGSWGYADCTMTMPQTAWKQYGNDWDAYAFNDPGKPAAFPGLDSTYTSPLGHTYDETKCAVMGFLYVGGNFAESGGGGNTVVYGVMFVEGTVFLDMNSQFRIYYNKEAGDTIKSDKLVLKRVSWQSEVRDWPL